MKTSFLSAVNALISSVFVLLTALPQPAMAVTGPGTSNNFGGRRVLVLGIDGCQRDALQAAIAGGRTPNLAGLANTGVAYWGLEAGGIYHTIKQQPTITGPGWSSVCSGVFHDKHRIEDNDNDKGIEGRFYLYPHFFKHIRELYSDVWLGSICDAVTPNSVLVLSENGIADLVYTPTSAEKDAGQGDVKVAEKVVETLQSENPDAVFVHFLDADHTGHTYGYGKTVPEYMDTLADIDGYIGDILTALHGRPQYAQEKWLIVVTADHGGGLNKSHGSQSDDDRHIFAIFNGPGYDGGMVRNGLTYQSLIAPTVLSYLGIGIAPEWGLESEPAPPSNLNPPLPEPVNGVSIIDPRRDIRNPKSTDAVSISANVTSVDPIVSVKLWLSTAQGSFASVPMNHMENARWAVTLPQYPDGTRVRYYIEAATASRESKLPLSLARLPYYVFTVEDDRVNESDLVINEICYNPAGSDNSTNSEWFEVYNRRNVLVDVSFYTAADTSTTPDDFIIPQGTVIPAHGYMILAWDKALFLNQFPALATDSNVVVVDTQHGFGINNDGDSPNLVHPNDFEWNRVKSECFEEAPYDVGNGWPGPSTDGFSIELKNPALDNMLAQNWAFTSASGGTPGSQNSAFEAGGVAVSGIERNLEYPTSADTVTVSADIIADAPIQSAAVHAQVGSSSVTFPMVNTGGDRWAGDFNAIPTGSLVKYYVSASIAGKTVNSPVGAPAERLTFRVDDQPAMPGDLVINELQYDPDGTDNGSVSEWFEIVNTTPRPQNIGLFGYRTRKDKPMQYFPEGTVIAPNGYLVVAGVQSLFSSQYPGFGATSAVLIDASWPQPSSTMTNSNNSLIEVRINHVNSWPVMRWIAPPAIDAVAYKRTDYPWPGEQTSLPNNNGFTVELLHPSMDNSDGGNWRVSSEDGGSPGEKNGVNDVPSSVSDWVIY